jgi:hypothetical protein
MPVFASIIPGYTNLPVASITFAALAVTFAPIWVMRPL